MPTKSFTPKPTRSLSQIEARLDKDRADLAAATGMLRSKVAPLNLLPGGLTGLANKAKSYVLSAGQAVRANPVATIMATAGVGWLVLGRRSASKSKEPALSARAEAMERWADDGGPVPPTPHEAWEIEADRLRHMASGLYGQIDRARKSGKAADLDVARHRADVLSALTADVRRAMQAGLEDLDAAARDAALAKREAALVARLSPKSVSGHVIHGKPFATGAVLAIASAAVAWCLPQSAAEARVLKSTGLRLLDIGKEVLGAEGRRVTDIASGLADALAHNLHNINRQIDTAARDIVTPPSGTTAPRFRSAS